GYAHRSGLCRLVLVGSEQPIVQVRFGSSIAGALVAIESNERTRHSLTMRQQVALLAVFVGFKNRLDPQRVSFVVQVHFAVLVEHADYVVLSLVERNGTLHHLAICAYHVVIRSRRITNLSAGSALLRKRPELEPLRQSAL